MLLMVGMMYNPIINRSMDYCSQRNALAQNNPTEYVLSYSLQLGYSILLQYIGIRIVSSHIEHEGCIHSGIPM